MPRKKEMKSFYEHDDLNLNTEVNLNDLIEDITEDNYAAVGVDNKSLVEFSNIYEHFDFEGFTGEKIVQEEILDNLSFTIRCILWKLATTIPVQKICFLQTFKLWLADDGIQYILQEQKEPEYRKLYKLKELGIEPYHGGIIISKGINIGMYIYNE